MQSVVFLTADLAVASLNPMPASVAWMCVRLPTPGWQHSFVEIDLKIFSTFIRSFPLIQEGQLSVSGERMYTMLFNRLWD